MGTKARASDKPDDPMELLRRDLVAAKAMSAGLACGSSCCPHSRHRGGQMVNGPCRCYSHDSTLAPALRAFIFTATRLITAAEDALQAATKS
jgi:hypothetical protein